MPKKSEVNFEQGLDQLEKVIHQLENGEITLDQSLQLFEEGVGLARLCTSKLDECEAKIEVLLERNGNLQKVPFETKDGKVANDDEA